MSLVAQLESILFVASKPLSFVRIAKALNISSEELGTMLEVLEQKYNREDSGVRLFKTNDEYQLVSSPENREVTEQFLKAEISGELTKPQLETLTVISYCGPITKPELEQIRGVNCSLIIRNLMMRGLVKEVDDVSVGNSCPSVYKINKNKIVVGVNGPEEKWNEETEEWGCLSDEEIIKTTLPGGYEGSICTDLWAFGAADLNNLISRIKYLDPNFQPIIGVNGLNIGTNFIVKVTPGRYRAMVTWHLITDTDSYPQIYTTIERIGDVLSKDPIPFKLGPEGIEEDFETSLKVNNLSYPELFPIRERILDHIFCVNGNGLDWAPNGTVPIMGRKAIQARKELKNGREVTIPNGYLEYYYPICEYSLIANVPDNIRPDWLKGVYETLDLLLKLDPEYKCFSGWKNTHNIEWAKKIKEELNKRFYDCTNK
jgi:segregation and condensation protein B